MIGMICLLKGLDRILKSCSTTSSRQYCVIVNCVVTFKSNSPLFWMYVHTSDTDMVDYSWLVDLKDQCSHTLYFNIGFLYIDLKVDM